MFVCLFAQESWPETGITHLNRPFFPWLLAFPNHQRGCKLLFFQRDNVLFEQSRDCRGGSWSWQGSQVREFIEAQCLWTLATMAGLTWFGGRESPSKKGFGQDLFYELVWPVGPGGLDGWHCVIGAKRISFLSVGWAGKEWNAGALKSTQRVTTAGGIFISEAFFDGFC